MPNLWTIVIILFAVLGLLFLLQRFLNIIRFLKKNSTTTKVDISWTNPNNQAGDVVPAIISIKSILVPLDIKEEEKFLSYLRITVEYNDKILKIFNSTELKDKILAISMKRAGEYTFHSSFSFAYFNYTLSGSPVTKMIAAGKINASQTEFTGQVNGNTVTVTTTMKYFLAIQPNDRLKNPCHLQDVDFNRFHFEHLRVDVHQGHFDANVPPAQINHSFGPNSYGELCLILEILSPSYWRGKISYDRQPIKGGDFDIIAISSDEENKLTKIVNENIGIREPHFSGFAEIIGQGFVSRYIVIYVGLSPNKLLLSSIDETTGRKRKFGTYLVSNRTKILFRAVKVGNNGQLTYWLEINDHIAEEFTFYLDASEGRILLALYAHYQAQSAHKTQFAFSTKRNLFFQELAQISSEVSIRPHIIRVSGDKEDIVQTTFQQVKRFSIQDWKEQFTILFNGQDLNGNGDLCVWFSTIMDTIFNEQLNKKPGMFSKFPKSEYVHPNTVNFRDSHKWRAEYYHLAGRILGKYLVDLALDRLEAPLFTASLSRSLLSILLGLLPTLEDVSVDHPHVYSTRFLPVINADDVATLDRTFSEEFDCLGNYLLKPFDLFPGGSKIRVTNLNRHRYLSSLAKYYMSTIASDEIHDLRTGFYTLVPEEMLTILDAEDLDTLLKFGKKPQKPCGSCFFGKPKPGSQRFETTNSTPWEKCREERCHPVGPNNNAPLNPNNNAPLDPNNNVPRDPGNNFAPSQSYDFFKHLKISESNFQGSNCNHSHIPKVNNSHPPNEYGIPRERRFKPPSSFTTYRDNKP